MKKLTFKDYLTIAVTVLVFAELFILNFVPIPESNEKVVYMALGIVFGVEATIISYHFGSSSGSAKKDETISTMMNK